MFKHILICTVIFIFHNIIYYSTTPQNYGEFSLTLSDIVMCKGPKRDDCCNNTAIINNGTNMQLYMDVKKNIIPNRGKMLVMVNGQQLVRLQMKKPCDHLFIKPVFQALLNVTDNCEFKKGIYNLNLDIEKLVQKYYGGMFFYGNLTFKSIFYNEECNFFCIIEEVILSPKKAGKET